MPKSIAVQTLRPRLLDNLYVYSHGERILYLNPALPDWISIKCKYKGIFDRFDGNHTVSDILQYADVSFTDDDRSLLHRQIINILETINIFTHSTAIKRRQHVPPFPRYIYLTLTDACNLNCSYCYTQDRQQSKPSTNLASFSQWKGFIDQIVDYTGFPIIFNFTGGEPLLMPYLFDLAEYIRLKGSQTVLLTNGTLIGNEKTAAKIAASFGQIRISLDSLDEKINSRLRGAGVVDKVKNAFFLLKEYGADVIIVSTVTKLNLDSLGPLVQAFSGQVSFQPLFQIGAGRKSPYVLSGDEYSTALRKAKIQKKLTSYYQNIHQYRLNPYKRCALAKEELSIAPDGSLFPCHLLHYPALEIGNLQRNSFKDLYEKSKILQEIRRINVDTLEQCRACPVRNFCGAACRARIDFTKKGLTGKDDFCIYEKQLILDALLCSYG